MGSQRIGCHSLSVSGLSVRRGERCILNQIDLEMASGAAVILHGANGAGKTTLLRALAGFIAVPKNSITLRTQGENIDQATRRDHMVYIGHRDGIHTALTVWENLNFWVKLYGSVSGDARQAADALGLSELLENPGAILSAGQRRRLALCRALISNKPIWLLDEPCASFDAKSERLFIDIIARHCAGGGSALIASHGQLLIKNARTVQLGGA